MGITIRFVVLFLKIPGPLQGLIIGILLLCQVLTCTVLGATDTCAVFHSVCGTVSISSLMAALMVSMPLGWDTLNNIIRWTLIYLCYGSWRDELNLVEPSQCLFDNIKLTLTRPLLKKSNCNEIGKDVTLLPQILNWFKHWRVYKKEGYTGL